MFRVAHLERAFLRDAHLEGADLTRAHLEGANLFGTFLVGGEKTVRSADLHRAIFDFATNINKPIIGDARLGGIRIADIRWGDTNLSRIYWNQLRIAKDEWIARQKYTHAGKEKTKARRLGEFETAVRAYRQLATALRGQGLNEDADRFAYRAQFMQRTVLRFQRKRGQYLWSGFLDFLAGYGYRPQRSFLAYLLAILIFASIYYFFGQSGYHLNFPESVVVSMTAFHGRGFFAGQFSPGDPQAYAAALESFIGLIIEVSFIATFTQRYFGR